MMAKKCLKVKIDNKDAKMVKELLKIKSSKWKRAEKQFMIDNYFSKLTVEDCR